MPRHQGLPLVSAQLNVALLVLAVTALTAAELPDYPSWRGPHGDGAAPDTEAKLISDGAKAKKLWRCEQELVQGYVNAGWGYRGSYAQPILADGRLYVPYWVPSGEHLMTAIYDQAQKKRLPDSHKVKERWLLDAQDVLLCVDAKTGKVLWQTAVDGGLNHSGDNPPPVHMAAAYADGKVCMLGTGGVASCMDAVSGKLLWKVDVPGARDYWQNIRAQCLEKGVLPGKRRGGYAVCANPCIADGVLVVHNTGGGLVGLDLKDGAIRWQVAKVLANSSSPVVWRHDGKVFIISVNRDEKVTCIVPGTGKVLWTAEGVRNTGTPVVHGDMLICGGSIDKIKHKFGKDKHGYEGFGVNAWTLSKQGLKEQWKLPLKDRVVNQAGMTVQQGHVYASIQTAEPGVKSNGSEMIAVELATGTVSDRIDSAAGYASLVSADGMVVQNHGRNFICYAAEPGKLRALGGPIPFGAGDSITPILVGGILFARGHTHMAAFDLRR